ncbi:hypothetical protein D3C71_1100180 [compost metagenome]
MFQRIFNQHLQGKRRHIQMSVLRINGNFENYSGSQAVLNQKHVRIQKHQFIFQRNKVFFGIHQHVTVNPGKVFGIIVSQLLVFEDQFGKYTQVVEHKMRVDLQFQ